MTAGGYVLALAVTLVVEAPVYAAGLPRLAPVEPAAAARLAVLVNVVSHAVAWLVLWPAFRSVLGPVPAFVAVEAIVCVAEWRAWREWRRFDGPGLAALVLVANGASLAAGAAAASVVS